MTKYVIFIVLGFCVGYNICSTVQVNDIRITVKNLFEKVDSLQEKRDVDFVPPMFWQKTEGMWESDVRYYFHGHEDLFLFRESFSIYDDNMFATAWITSCLLEAYRYGNAPKPSEDTILSAILSIREYHDKNADYANSLMTFWPQVYNTSTQFWNSYPINIHHFFDEIAGANVTWLERILKDIGLSDIANIMESLVESESRHLAAFIIPPDFDDSFVNLGLGSLLSEMQDVFPKAHAQWRSQNTNISSIFDAIKKYAYRPFSNDSNTNTIDCRTYFFLRHFLQESSEKGENISLVPTWDLFKRIESLQEKKDVRFTPPMFWQKTKGMWESDVRFYFHGHEDLFLFRESFSIYDDNMFATAWITSCLLEAYRYGNAPKPSEDAILSAILSIREYHDKNVDYANSLMTFWPQVYNTSTQFWNSYPINLHHFFDEIAGANVTWLERILKDIGLSDIANIMENLLAMQNAYLNAFIIPPDFDDTFVNVGLGSLLAEMQDVYPKAHAQWRSQNTNISSVFDAVKKYAYRPSSVDNNVNTIDCRTYFFLRHFIQETLDKGENVSLIPTWIQNYDELKTQFWKGVAMPLNVNNVDVTVAANSVFGMTSSILNGLVKPDVLNDPEIQQVYLNTSSYIAYMIKANFSARPDLALLYYPSAIEFYWFVARTYAELVRYSRTKPLPHPALIKVESILDEALHKYMTAALLNKTQTDTDGTVYFDDFLGDGDLDSDGNTIVRGQDRLFTTGMAINALISTWTVFNGENGKLIWEKDVPDNVKNTVSKAATFLQNHALGLKYQHWNAFFSGSVKGNSSWPTFPANKYNISTPKGQILGFGVEGIIPETEYKKLLDSYQSQGYAPEDFHGYNSSPDFWPFWSSEPYTYVTNMLALSKYSNIIEA